MEAVVVKNEIMAVEETGKKMMRKSRDISVSLEKRTAGHERNGWVKGEGC